MASSNGERQRHGCDAGPQKGHFYVAKATGESGGRHFSDGSRGYAERSVHHSVRCDAGQYR